MPLWAREKEPRNCLEQITNTAPWHLGTEENYADKEEKKNQSSMPSSDGVHL